MTPGRKIPARPGKGSAVAAAKEHGPMSQTEAPAGPDIDQLSAAKAIPRNTRT